MTIIWFILILGLIVGFHEFGHFIAAKTKGHRVFMRFDDVKYDTDNNLMCYLYLENKTFINAHLLKEKLALPDMITPYRYRQKFATYKMDQI